jgi:RNA polymerase sigma factor for flagellar operon FliA
MDWATRSQRKQRKELSAQPAEENPADVAATAPKITFYNLGPIASLSSRSDAKDELPVPEVACEERMHPDRMYERREARELVRKALEALPERYRQVVLMYYLGEESMREIGRSLGVNESRVSQIHKAALGRMKQALAEQREAGLARVTAA